MLNLLKICFTLVTLLLPHALYCLCLDKLFLLVCAFCIFFSSFVQDFPKFSLTSPKNVINNQKEKTKYVSKPVVL